LTQTRNIVTGRSPPGSKQAGGNLVFRSNPLVAALSPIRVHTLVVATVVSLLSPASGLCQIDSTQASTSEDRAIRLFVRALTLARTGDHEQAAAILGEAARLAPREPAIFLSLSESHFALQDTEAALFYAQQAANLSDNVEYLRHLAHMQVAAGRLESADQTYGAIVETYPDDSDAVFEMARLKVRLGRESDAAVAFERLIRMVGDDRILRTRLLQLYGRTNDVDGVERTLRALIELDGENPHYHLMLSDFLVRNQRLDEAIDALERAQEIIPGDLEITAELGSLHRASGRMAVADSIDASITDVEGLTAAQVSVRAERLYVRALTDTSAAEAAIDVLSKGLGLHDGHYQMLTMLGDLRYRRGEFSAAADLLSRALVVDPRDPDVWLQTALAYLNANQPARAAEIGEEGILLFPGRVDLVETTAHSHLVLYANTRAIELYHRALDLLAEDESASAGLAVEAHASLGFLYSRRSLHEQSDHHYREALRIDSTHVFALNNFAYSLAQRQVHLAEALAHAQRANRLAPDNPSFEDTLGWILFLLDRPDESREWLLKAVEATGDNATMLEHLGDVEAQLGLDESARERWARALSINPESESLKLKLGHSTP
jgi:tetratricopeptide (TPR) repeat protein